MSQDTRMEQPEDGAQTGNFSQRSEAVLKTLEERLLEFSNIALSVNVMNKSLTSMRTEIEEMKAWQAAPTGQGSSVEQPEQRKRRLADNDEQPSGSNSEQPNNKRPRNDAMDNENQTSEAENPEEDEVDRYMNPEDEESSEEEDDVVRSLGHYFNDDAEVGPKLDEELANMANAALRGKVQSEKMKKLAEKYKRPANVENLQVPKVEETLWRQLCKEAKVSDYILQKSQSSYALALIPIIKAVGAIHNMKSKEMRELRELITDAFKILTLEVTNNHEIRREKIKKELEPKYRGICNKDTSTTKLFGDQLQDAIKAMGDSKFNLTLHQSAKRSFLRRRGGAKTFPRNQNGHRNNNSYNNQKSESRFKSQRYRKPRGQNKK